MSQSRTFALVRPVLNSYHKLIPLATDWWLIEFLSWTLAVVCLAISVAVLKVHDGRPLPATMFLDISLNAHLSILSAIVKLALAVPIEEALGSQRYLWFSRNGNRRPLMDFERFDDAARGPIGALRLLSRTRARSLASIGGIAFLLSLGLDPVFQQLISLPTRPSLENRSKLPQIRRLESTNLLVNNGSEEIGFNGGMHTAIGTFFIGLNGLQLADTSFFCSSDYCDWPRFTTLGVCSRCESISEELQFGCAQDPGDWRREYTQVLNGARPSDLNRTSCGWFFNLTSERPMLMSGYSQSEDSAVLADDALVMRILNMRDPLTNEIYWNGTMRFPHISAPITNLAIVNSHDAQSVFEHKKPDAYNCAMEWCSKTFEASFSKGMLNERLISVFTNTTQTPDPFLVQMLDDYWDYTYTRDIILRQDGAPNTISVSNTSALSTRFTWDNWSPSFLTQSNASDLQWLRYMNGYMPAQGGFQEGARNSDGARWIADGHIPDAMNNIADAMTTVLRNNRKISEDVLGSGSPRVFVEVRWIWLVFPSCLLVLTLLFLVVTMRQMSNQQRVWKGSSLTTLVHGLSWDAKYAFRDAKSMQDIRDISSELRVFLNPEKEGGTLDVDIDEKTGGSWDEKFIFRYLKNTTV